MGFRTATTYRLKAQEDGVESPEREPKQMNNTLPAQDEKVYQMLLLLVVYCDLQQKPKVLFVEREGQRDAFRVGPCLSPVWFIASCPDLC